jgi:BirA family biotin operon repressor/biotin-[acetyl-CoA-carboxylase] ligase
MVQEILSHFPENHPWTRNIHWFDTIDSTNTKAKTMAASGAPHGTVIVAGHQSGGRGRMGRSFHSPAGLGLYLSVILRPECLPTELMHLTCAAAVAACHAVAAETDLRPSIKWTNDLVFGFRKLGGILTELSLSANGTVNYAIVGIGINCNHRLPDFPPELQEMAASLAMHTGKPVDRCRLAAQLIRQLYDMDRGLLRDKGGIMDLYRAGCMTLGREVSIHRFEEVRHGTAMDVDDDGGLVVRFPDGHTETVAAGEVSVRGMYGYL